MGKLTDTSVRAGILAKLSIPSSLPRLAKSTVLLLLTAFISFLVVTSNSDDNSSTELNENKASENILDPNQMASQSAIPISMIQSVNAAGMAMPPSHDVELELSVDPLLGMVEVGQVVTFTITATNNSSTALDSLKIVNYVPAGYTFADNNNWIASGDNACLTATISNGLIPMVIPPGSEISFVLDLTVSPMASIDNLTNLASVVGSRDLTPLTQLDDSDQTNSSDTETVILGVSGLGGIAWKDINGDGFRDDAEPPVMGVEVTLEDCDGVEIGSTTSDANGEYFFDNLLPGEYRIQADITDLPEGCAYTQQGQINNEYSISLPDVNDYVVIGDVAPSGTSYTKEAWINMTSTSCDNIISSFENPFFLFGGNLTAGHSGNYFEVQDPAAFPTGVWVHVAVTYDAASSTLKLYKNGVEVASNSNASMNTGGTTAIGKHFAGGCHGDGSFDEVRIWDIARSAASIIADMNTTLSGSEANLTAYYNMEDGPGATELTDVTGNGFTGSFVDVNAATAFVDGVTEITSSNLDSDVDLLGEAACITLQGGDFSRSQDVGLLVLSSIGDFVWYDIDEDGIQDLEEPGIEGVEVSLYDENDVLLLSTTTDANGEYLFENIYPASYYLVFGTSGYDVTLANIGADDELDNDVDNSNVNANGSTTSLFTIQFGTTFNQSLDAGLVPLHSIGNQVWSDLNFNGLIDLNEPGIEGVTVELYSPDGLGGSTFLQSTMTDANGVYIFDSLRADKYLVVIPATDLVAGGVLEDYLSTTGTLNQGGIYEDMNAPIDADNNINLDDNGVLDGNVDFPGAVVADTVTLGESMEPITEGDDISLDLAVDASGAFNENSNLTIDFGFAEKIYDIALIKTTDSPINNNVGDIVPFTFTVYNQGNVPLINIVINDFNPTGFSAVDAQNIPLGWTAGIDPGVSSTFLIDTELAAGANQEINYFVMLETGSSKEEYTNIGEVASFEDVLGNSTIDQSIEDVDSTPDVILGNDQGGIAEGDSDDIINGVALDENGATGVIGVDDPISDEDDQDPSFAYPCGDNCTLTCKGDFNVSVDPLTCMAEITPSAVSEDIEPDCDFYYTITLIDEHGVAIPSNIVDASYIGQTITYELSEPECNNKCWGTALIEDKLAPTITVQDFTVSCADLYEQGTVAMLLPTVGDDCQNTLPPVLIEQEEKSVDCNNPALENVIGTIERTYVAQDTGGNTSDPVTQIITLVRVTVGAIASPDDVVFPFDTLSCSSGYATDEFGYPDPSVTGVPTTLQENYGEAPATYSYIDISDPANRVLVGDDVSITINLGAEFPIYDMRFNTLNVSMNGYITSDLSDSGFDFVNVCPIPSDPNFPSTTTGARIYPLHDDLQADLSEDPNAGVFYTYMPVSPVLTPSGMLTGVNIFQWKVDHFIAAGVAELDFQALLFDNGEIVYQYNTIDTEMGSGASVGIQSFAMEDNSVPLYGTQISCNEANSVNSLTAIGLTPPTMGGTDLFPFPENVFCNGFSEYTDMILVEDSCITKILRTFIVGEWRCNDTEERMITQFIDIIDIDGPTMTQLPNMLVTTAPFSCAANVLLPEVTPQDNCNPEDIIIDIEYQVGPRLENVSGENLVTMPTGTHKVTYQATDKCGNMTEMSFTVTVQDKSSPIAICDADELFISTGTAYFSAEALNNGSFDDCGAVTLQIARADDPLYPTIAAFSEAVEFDCDDIDKTFEVVLLVTDSGGNTGICKSDLKISDKIKGFFSSVPADITLDCTEDLEAYVYELPTIIDNCINTAIITTVDTIEAISSCGTGLIKRTFTIDETDGVEASQFVTIQNLNDPLKESDIDWPDDYENIVDGCIDDLTPGGLGNIDPIYGFPTLLNESLCIKVGESYDDVPYSTDDICRKIQRTWKIIDWCTQNPDGTYPAFTHIQNIKIANSGTPVFTTEFIALDVLTDEDCISANVEDLIVTATHSCNLEYSYTVDLGNDGGATDSTGEGPDASGIYPLGSHAVTFTVADSCGNVATETIIVNVICPDDDIDIISGRIITETVEEVESAQVGLTGIDVIYDMTEETGEYAFPEMPSGGDYMVVPYKNDNHTNGVSTLDLVLVQRHILGLSLLDSPYKMIAADVNYNQGISAADIVILRKVILGVYDEFPSNNSWRFVDAEYVFPDATDPWLDNVPEEYEIISLNSDMNIDFIGVKTGDVNGSVIANAQSVNLEVRGSNTWNISIDDQQVVPGELVTVEIKSADISNVYGWQYSLETKDLSLINVAPAKANISKDNINNDGSKIHMSYAKANSLEIKKNEVLFTLTLEAHKSGKLSEMISINDKGLRPESYHTDMIINNVEIRWNTSETELFDTEIFAVQQNQPNPWYDKTSVGYYIPQSGDVKFVVKDITGRILHSISAFKEQGSHTQEIEAKLLSANGVLLYELHYQDQVISNKMIHIK